MSVFLKGRVPAILLILMLLVAEAWCDLALPGYTSDIVDVGIQQGGIASPLPEQLQSDSMELLPLIPRFYDASEGSITQDGQDIRSISQHHLRQQLGYVPQKGILFSGDIESNLKFGGEHISDDAMVSAAPIAQANDFISQKAEGYHAPIAQGGFYAELWNSQFAQAG